MRSPLLLSIDAAEEGTYMEELFGPISFLIKTDSTAQSIQLAHKAVHNHGAITMGCYTTDATVLAQIESAALDAGVALSSNLTGGVYVNQSAAFSDFHATGCNPAANACLSDLAYVANRFRVVQSRKHG